MLEQILEKCIESLRPAPAGPDTDGLYAIERFHELLDRERSRADRNCHGFSLVLFELAKEKGPRQARALAKTLKGRMRVADAAGWIDADRIGVVLPETRLDGAMAFVAHVQRDFPENRVPYPAYTIRMYPSDNIEKPGSRSSWGKTALRRPKGPQEGIPPRSRLAGAQSHDGRPASADTAEGTEGAPQGASQGDIMALCAPVIPRWKRVFDFVGALSGLLLFSPLIVSVAALIKIVSPGPAFFKQERIGYLGRRFTMWKFRTMSVNHDASAHREYLADLINAGEADAKPMVKKENAASVIPFGRVLRAACIDEIPQLFNVLRGEMSLVGPRPPIPYEAKEYKPWHAHRFETLPGMTGLWQVSGKNRLTFREMVRLDIRYARRVTMAQDVKILLKTFPVVVALAFEKVASKMSQERSDDRVTQQAA